MLHTTFEAHDQFFFIWLRDFSLPEPRSATLFAVTYLIETGVLHLSHNSFIYIAVEILVELFANV